MAEYFKDHHENTKVRKHEKKYYTFVFSYFRAFVISFFYGFPPSACQLQL